METLKDKAYKVFDYTSRYTNIPYYYDTLADRQVFGIGKNMKKDTDWVSHKVKQGDTLESLALNYYNNPTFWWIIAYFNDIQDAFMNIADKFTIIKIPSISSIEFGDER